MLKLPDSFIVIAPPNWHRDQMGRGAFFRVLREAVSAWPTSAYGIMLASAGWLVTERRDPIWMSLMPDALANQLEDMFRLRVGANATRPRCLGSD